MSIPKLKIRPKDLRSLHSLAIKEARKRSNKKLSKKEAVNKIRLQYPILLESWLYRNLEKSVRDNIDNLWMKEETERLDALCNYVHQVNYASKYEVDKGEKQENVIQRFDNSKWWLYYYHTTSKKEAALARAVLYFDKGGQVKVNNIKTDTDTDYKGLASVYVERHLVFNLTTDPYDKKSLRMHTYIGHAKVFPIMLGTFCNINHIGAMEAGTVLLHKIDNEVKNPKPSVIIKNSPAYKKIHTNIKKYFANKGQNFVKAPARPIDLDTLGKWLEEKEKLKKGFPKLTDKKYQAVIATPISSLVNSQLQIGTKELATIADSLVKYCSFSKDRIHYHGKDKDISNISKIPHIMLKNAKNRINNTAHLILIYPPSKNSSVIAELAWALDIEIPTIVFCHKKSDLPLMFQDSSGYQIYEYQDINHIHKLFKDHGKALFREYDK